MAYLEEFQMQLENHDYQGFMHLWEEYCGGDEVDAPELQKILQAIKVSDFAQTFGKHIDSALALWSHITDENASYEVFKSIIDLQTTNSPQLADLTYQIIHKRFSHLPFFNEKLRLVGLRNKEIFQGAVANFELLSHMAKGKFVFHTGGWGTGEIVDISLVREQLVLEFDRVRGRRDLSFANAFKNLIPLRDDHFLAKRFGDPDQLEEEAKKDPAAIIRLLLSDLGPKTATEIKDELCGLVVADEEWTKWWQGARAKIKKDTMIETPPSVKDPFRLRSSELSHEDRLLKVIEKLSDIDKTIETIYSFIRDYPEILRNPSTKTNLQERISYLLNDTKLTPAQKIQLYLLLEDLGAQDQKATLSNYIQQLPHIPSVIKAIQVGAFKKRALVICKEMRSDWDTIFLDLLFTLPVHSLRDYLIKELNCGKMAPLLEEKLNMLIGHPYKAPDLFVWYFQKATSEEALPFSDSEGRGALLEGLLMLLSQIEQKPEERDLVKKIHNILSGHRFAAVRAIIDGKSLDFIKEFLLLVTKCQSLSDHDSKILHSLAYVVQPSLANKNKALREEHSFETIWTTKEGFQKVQARIQQIGTIETVENAKEIEVARSHGDLRENSEYKFALERRARLQGELKFLTSQINKARIITEQDIPKEEAGIGTIVTLATPKGEEVIYTLLGPWDADPDKNILSLQSKFAEAMTGTKVGESFTFQDETYTVKQVKSYLNNNE
ncbi:MAG: GreA/GreB family elongation factor [Chlamydiales bacterium]|nr:GreA/GreB family elongation factor [Chlamydiales bacterium]